MLQGKSQRLVIASIVEVKLSLLPALLMLWLFLWLYLWRPTCIREAIYKAPGGINGTQIVYLSISGPYKAEKKGSEIRGI